MSRDAASVVVEPIPGLCMRVSGDRRSVDHFVAEYGQSVPAAGAEGCAIELTLGKRLAGGDAEVLTDSHKTVRWRFELTPPDTSPIRVGVVIRGWPRWLALSLAQGFLVEPLLSIQAPERGHVLLPAAGLQETDGALLLVGRSRTGKSSICAAALAAGGSVLGDDQVLVDATGAVRRFPRRLRLYDDLEATAPQAYARLTRRARTELGLRRAARVLSRGLIAPSLAVPLERLGAVAAGPLPVSRLVVVHRSRDARGLTMERIDIARALDEVALIQAQQRARFEGRAPKLWVAEIGRTEAAERVLLASAVARTSAWRLDVPDSMSARIAVRELASALDISI